jgi:hypothetical protein
VERERKREGEEEKGGEGEMKEKLVYFQDLVYVIVTSAGRIPSCLGDVSLCLLRPSTAWMKPTLFIQGNLLYLMSTNLNAVIQKTPLEKHPEED